MGGLLAQLVGTLNCLGFDGGFMAAFLSLSHLQYGDARGQNVQRLTDCAALPVTGPVVPAAARCRGDGGIAPNE